MSARNAGIVRSRVEQQMAAAAGWRSNASGPNMGGVSHWNPKTSCLLVASVQRQLKSFTWLDAEWPLVVPADAVIDLNPHELGEAVVARLREASIASAREERNAGMRVPQAGNAGKEQRSISRSIHQRIAENA